MGVTYRFAGIGPLARYLAAAGSLALIILVLSGSVLPGTALAAYPGGNGLIAFVRGGNIFTVNPSHVAGSLVKLTTDGRASSPRWSPTGKQLAYVDRGNLWVMHANGSHKTRLTDGAPKYTDSRPSWSPDGDYLAFVQTERGHSYGDLVRYTLASHLVRYFTTTIGGQLIRVTALPAPVAWAWAKTGPDSVSYGSYIAYEGAAALCDHAHEYCLNLLGFHTQSGYRNGFPSAEEAPTKFRLTDADWYPLGPVYYSNLMTTQEDCHNGHCTPLGLAETIEAAPAYPGAYQGVFSPDGTLIAFTRNSGGRAEIYLAYYSPLAASATSLIAGSEPDWQPVPAATN